MDKDNRVCYITYAIPMDAANDILIKRQKEEFPELPPYPQGFMPTWFQNGKFPEDDID